MSKTLASAAALAVAAGMAVLLLTACRESDSVHVQLHAQPAEGNATTVVAVDAQVSGPLEGLKYKWFAVSGVCEPQESDRPATLFRFAEGARQDQVSLEVWRNGERVAEDHIRMTYDDQSPAANVPGVRSQIEITQIPPLEPGGEKTHAYIGGTVKGDGVSNCFVAVYVRASGKWYIQPTSGALQAVRQGKEWDTWTHTGQKYAALLVRRDFEPLDKLDMLPEVRDGVLAAAVVDGADPTQPVSKTDAK